MAVTALLRFQINSGDGPSLAPAGEAASARPGMTFTATNSDNTNVNQWKFEILDVPPGSAVPKTTQGPGALSSFTSATLDVSGSYRVRLTVTNTLDGSTDVDIRCVVVATPNLNFIPPPYQANPPPLPLTGPGAKPDELNVNGQPRGWMGTLDVQLMHAIILAIDAGITGGASGPAGGDLGGNYPNPSVLKLNGASVPVGAGMATGNVLKATGPTTYGLGAVNLAGGAGHVTGLLPLSSLAAPTFTVPGTFTGLTLTGFGLGIAHVSSGGVFSSSLIVDADVSGTAAIAGSKISANFGVQTVTGGTASFSGVVNGAGGSFTANVDMHSNNINNLPDPVLAQQPATKHYVDNFGSASADLNPAPTGGTTTTVTIAVPDDSTIEFTAHVQMRGSVTDSTRTLVNSYRHAQTWKRCDGGAPLKVESLDPAAVDQISGAGTLLNASQVAASGNNLILTINPSTFTCNYHVDYSFRITTLVHA